MRVVVFGASGGIGRYLVPALRERGAEVVAAQRSSGVDVGDRAAVARVCEGADAVVDATNVTTTRSKTAVDFFTTAARNISGGASAAGIERVVPLSIINAADPAVNSRFGYYQGKGAQEQTYRELLSPDVLTVVRSAQWYELAEQMLGRARLGPLALVPHMTCRPLSAADAAAVLADAATGGARGDVEVAGPAVLDLVDLSKHIARQSGSPKWVFGINFGGSALRTDGLLPRGDFVQTATTVDQWLAQRSENEAR